MATAAHDLDEGTRSNCEEEDAGEDPVEEELGAVDEPDGDLGTADELGGELGDADELGGEFAVVDELGRELATGEGRRSSGDAEEAGEPSEGRTHGTGSR
jgi:hypothetical protein